MLEALSKVAQRRMYICNSIISYSQQFDTEKIAAKFHTTDRVIVNDFKFLSAHIKNLDIQILPDQIIVNSSRQFALSEIYRYYFNTEDVFILLDYLFYHPECSIKDITNDCFISRSKLYRLINKINPALSPFGIQVSSSANMSINGRESAIRLFYAQFFSEKYQVQSNEFQLDHKELLDQLIIKIMQVLNLPQTFANFRHLYCLVYTNFIRYQQGYLVRKVEGDSSHILKELQQDPTFAELADQFTVHFGVPLNQTLIVQLFYNYIQPQICFDPEQFAQLAQSDPYFIASVDYLNQMLDSFLQEYPYVTLDNRQHLIMLIHNTTLRMANDINVSYLLYDYNPAFNNEIKQFYPKMFNKYYQFLADYIKLMGQPVSRRYVIHLMNTIAFAWPTLYRRIKNNYTHPVRISIISDISTEFAQLVCDIFADRFSNMVIASPYKGLSMTPDSLDCIPADLLVFTFDVQDPPQQTPFICVERSPNERDHRRIKRLIDTLMSQKETQLNQVF